MVTVKYFANLRQMAGKEEDRFELEGEVTLEGLTHMIGKSLPQIGEMVRQKKIMISINYDVVPLDTVVKDGDEIALLPPFSGGL
ncbi:MoaD/ThiS family protein [Nitrospina sp. 32_T5]|uniref:MoaD/ThiS family protein n=1 Tax=unclassified Nitrospina TaxID=2638683 RepID=UPI003F9B4FED